MRRRRAAGDELRHGRHGCRTRLQCGERAFVGSRQRSRENAAGRDDAAGICQHAERDDARNLLRLREIDSEVFGDLARTATARHRRKAARCRSTASPAAIRHRSRRRRRTCRAHRWAARRVRCARSRARRRCDRRPATHRPRAFPSGPSPAICSEMRSLPLRLAPKSAAPVVSRPTAAVAVGQRSCRSRISRRDRW